MHTLELALVDLPRGEAPERLGERDLAFEARERGADAEVGAVTEGEMTVDRAADVEGVGVLEMTFIAVARAVEQRHA